MPSTTQDVVNLRDDLLADLGSWTLGGRSNLVYWYDHEAQALPGSDTQIPSGDQIHAKKILEFDVIVEITNEADFSGPNDVFLLSQAVRSTRALWVTKGGTGEQWRLPIADAGGLGVGNVRPAPRPIDRGGVELSVILVRCRFIPEDAGMIWTSFPGGLSGLGAI